VKTVLQDFSVMMKASMLMWQYNVYLN
jgi:hypothetical protein